MDSFLPRRCYIINASLLAMDWNDINKVDFSVTSMCSKLILKIFIELKASFYEESLLKLQLLSVKGKVWSGCGEVARIWLVPLVVTGKRGHPC